MATSVDIPPALATIAKVEWARAYFMSIRIELPNDKMGLAIINSIRYLQQCRISAQTGRSASMQDIMKPRMREHFADERPISNSIRSEMQAGIVSRWKRRTRRTIDGLVCSKDAIDLPSPVQVGKGLGEQAFKRPVLIGTFHKTGTMLMLAILREFCQHAELGFWNVGRRPIKAKNWTVGFDWWSDFGDRGLDPSEFPTVLIVRDPRDVLVSSMKFHCLGKEHWLRIPEDALDGKTYQQALLDLPSDEERLLFELTHQGGATIADMVAAKRDHRHANSLFLPLEALMFDHSMSAYSNMFRYLGLAECYVPLALSVAYKHSIFNPAFRKTRHITSGKASIWKNSLSPKVLQVMGEIFPDAIAELGYAN